MDTSDGDGPTRTRRGFLGGVAGLTAVAGGPSVASAARSPVANVTVLTWNAYLGVAFSKLLEVSSPEEASAVASEFRDRADPELYAARADAIAAGVERADADVVALQEVGTVRVEGRETGSSGTTDTDRTKSIDFLDLIDGALSDRGLDYEVAATVVTTELELAGLAAGGDPVDLRIADRDALLVRGDVGVEATASGTYDATERVGLLDGLRTVTLRRGFCRADVTVDDAAFTAVSTHLEALSGTVRYRQAGELLERLPTDRPVVLAGDFNSGPGAETATYDRLTRTFEDAYAAGRPGADGFTCCQASDLRNDRSRLDRRVDAVLYRGEVWPTGVERVGHRRSDRVEVAVDGTAGRVWPSDHAGVAATLSIAGPTPVPTGTERTATAGSTRPRSARSERTAGAGESAPGGDATDATETRSSSGPGMGTLAAVVGLGSGIATGLRRR